MYEASSFRPTQPSYPLASLPVTDDIPEAFTCPISDDLMRDPVRIADGTQQCYERDEIQRWFDRCGSAPRSPMTNRELQTKKLTPADDVRQQLEARASVPSAPPLPVDCDFYDAGLPLHPVETGEPAASFASAPPLHLVPPPPSGPSASAPVMPSAPPLPGVVTHADLPQRVPPPQARAVGATAKDFANVSALARRDLQTAIRKQGACCLSSVAAATLGAAGGLMVGGFVAAGFAMGTLVLPCVGVAAGLALVGAGALAGAWLRQRLTGKAQHEPHVAAKLTALTEMRSAFETLHERTKDEDASLAHVRTALGEFDAGRSLRRHIAWAAGAAVIAIPVGVGATLLAVARAQDSKKDDRGSTATGRTTEAPWTRRAATPGLGAASGASARWQIHHHIHHHYHSAPWGSRAYWHLQDWVNPRPAAPPPMPARRGVRVDMQPRWLKALDPQSYARMCDTQGARP